MSNTGPHNSKQKSKANDPRLHRKLFGTLLDYDESKPPFLYYVENGSFIAGHDQLASDYKMAADLLIATERDSGLSNWLAPTVLVVRQTLELALEALLEATVDRGNTFDRKLMFSHDLASIWAECAQWLTDRGYMFNEDARRETADWMIENFHAVDPTGDLFRFAHSKHDAFGRKKTYDRVGVNAAVFASYFEATYSFLNHWQGVLVMEWVEEQARKDGIEYTRPLDPDDFPRRG